MTNLLSEDDELICWTLAVEASLYTHVSYDHSPAYALTCLRILARGLYSDDEAENDAELKALILAAYGHVRA